MTDTSTILLVAGFVRWSILIILSLMQAPCSAAEVYKWTDEEGQIHYGSRAKADNAVPVEIEPAPSLPADHAERREKQRRLLNLFAEEREQKLEEQAIAAREKQLHQQNCQRARDYYQKISTAGALYDVDDDGNQIILDDEQRQAEETRIRQYIEKWCD